MNLLVIALASALGTATGYAVYYRLRMIGYRNDYNTIWNRCNQDMAELYKEIERLKAEKA